MTDVCEDCGREITENHAAFTDQWEPSRRELCYPHVNFGGAQLCAERTVERLKTQLAAARRVIEAADRIVEVTDRPAHSFWAWYRAARAEFDKEAGKASG